MLQFPDTKRLMAGEKSQDGIFDVEVGNEDEQWLPFRR